jgi:hypothetical protein
MSATGTPRTAIVFGVLLGALLVVAGALAPRLVDVRGLAPTIAADLSESLGHAVNVRGDVLLSIIPGPQLIIRDVATAPDPTGRFSLSVEDVRADLAWSDLLLGRYRITRVVFNRPDIEARITDWPTLSADGPRIVLDHARVTLKTDTRDVLIEAMDVAITPSDELTLAVMMSGTAEGMPFNLESRFGPERPSARTASATLRLPEADITIDFVGNMSAEPRSAKGRLTLSALRAGDVAALSGLANLDAGRWFWASLPTTISADVELKPDNATLSAGEASVGSQSLRWSGDVGAATFNIKVAPVNIDLATWLPRRPAQNDSSAPSAAISPSVLGLSMPARGTITLDGSSLMAAQQPLRDVAATLAWSDNAWALRDAAVTLPGQTRISLAGLWTDTENDVGFDGSWRADVQDEAQLLTWLGLPVAADAPRVFTGFSATGLMQSNDRLMVLSDIAAQFDSTTATGRVSFGWDAAAPVVVDLAMDRLALDAYVPVARGILADLIAQTPSGGSTSGYGVNPFVPWLSRVISARGSVRIAVPQLTWRDALSGALGVDVALADGVIDVRAISFADATGTSAWIGGKLRNLDGVPTAESLQFDLKVGDVPRLLRTARTDVPAPLRNLAPWSVTGAVNGSVLDATVAVDGKLGPIVVTARGKASLAEQNPKLDASIELTHPNAGQLRDVAWGGAKFATKLDGAANVTAALSIAGDGWSLSEIKVGLGPYAATGDINVDNTTSPATVRAMFDGIDLDINALSPTFVLPLAPPGDWQGEVKLSGTRFKSGLIDAQDFGARFVASANAVELAEWQGKLFGGPAKVSTSWAIVDGQHQLRGQVSVTEAEAARMTEALPAASKAIANLDITFSSQAATPQNWMSGLSGSGTATLSVPPNTAVKPTGPLAALLAVNQAESITGQVAARQEGRAVFQIESGVVTFSDLSMQSNAYTGAFRGTANLNTQVVDLNGTLRLRDRGVIAGPSAKLVLPPSVPATIIGPWIAPNIKLDLSQR